MIHFTVIYNGQVAKVEHSGGPFELGRGPQRENIPRHTINDSYVSGNHVRIEQVENSKIRILNLSQRNSIRLDTSEIISIGTSAIVLLPITLFIGETSVKIELVEEEDEVGLDEESKALLDSMESAITISPGQSSGSLLDLGQSPSPEKLAVWFETLIAVQKSASGSLEFFQDTAQAVVNLIGLDRGLVLMIKNGRWMVQARFPDEDVDHREFSMSVLGKMAKERKTFYQGGAALQSQSESVIGIEAVIASPIFDKSENVVGAIYGVRNKVTAATGPNISVNPLEAQIVQLLASSVGAGLARQEQEAEAGRLRVQFEQFFSADLARELQKNPKLLEGHESEITVLFSDIRGFSRISETLNPRETCNLVADVMEEMTSCIMSFDGVVVDYSGDGIMAMWNAPAPQADHAIKACKAALAMVARMPAVQERWKNKISLPVKVGIGINSGMALCGNTGSKMKFQYGALGHTVNLASRIEGATKVMGVPILISGFTKKMLGGAFATRRLRKVRVIGINEPVDIYQLHAEVSSIEWRSDADVYESALKHYEAKEFGPACRDLYPLIANQNGNYDTASLSLMAKAIEFLRKPPLSTFDGVEDLESK
ncbi:MAG: adenylate/guanylate cyclase domain-containing protein [Planctomycetes bacterium]|nr:adenylate/guanylate cyclase domain-containing protein [Planctomycetota bacterium]